LARAPASRQRHLPPYLSDKTAPEQREALLTIMSGKAGNAWFEVLASVVSKVLDPKIVPIVFSFDLKSRKAKVKFGNELETTSEPIKNLATGDEHHILVDMPNGMEYRRPEIATTGILKSSGPLKFDCPGAHSLLTGRCGYRCWWAYHTRSSGECLFGLT